MLRIHFYNFFSLKNCLNYSTLYAKFKEVTSCWNVLKGQVSKQHLSSWEVLTKDIEGVNVVLLDLWLND